MASKFDAEVKGKVYVITGSSTGIGKALVLRLAKLGAKIVLSNRNVAEGEKALKEVMELSGRGAEDFLFVPTDVTKTEDLKALHEKSVAKFGVYDGLVLNSGGAGSPKNSFQQWDDAMDGFHDGWLQDLSLNLIAPLYSARMASKMWCDADKPGVLVFTVSYYAYAPCPLPVYGLSKCALNHFAMNISSMSKEGFPIYKNFRKIRMNTITPGYVHTPIFGGTHEEIEKSPFMGGHIKALGGWVNMDHLIDEYINLLGDPEANGKAVVTPTGNKSIYPKPFPEATLYVPLCEIPEGYKTEASYGGERSIF